MCSSAAASTARAPQATRKGAFEPADVARQAGDPGGVGEAELERALGDRLVGDVRRGQALRERPGRAGDAQRPLQPRHAIQQDALGAAERAGIGDEEDRFGHRAPLASRLMAPRGTPETPLRVRTARGGAVNAAFLSGAELLVLAQGLLATALLGPDLIGLYGVVTTTAMTIVALRRVGIDEAFVQTAADDEEAEFQRALTVELALGAAGRAGGGRAGAGARRGLRRFAAAGADARGELPAGRVRAAGAAVGLLQAHGVRAAADAAGDRPARHGGRHGAAAAVRRRGLGARDRPVLRQPGRDRGRLACVAVPAAAALRS